MGTPLTNTYSCDIYQRASRAFLNNSHAVRNGGPARLEGKEINVLDTQMVKPFCKLPSVVRFSLLCQKLDFCGFYKVMLLDLKHILHFTATFWKINLTINRRGGLLTAIIHLRFVFLTRERK